MAEGLVTFFKFTHLGFFKRNTDGNEYVENLSMDELLSNLKQWFDSRGNIRDTLMWDDDTPGYALRKRVYIKSIQKNEDTGDYILLLWRAVGNGDGVYGIPADTSLEDDALYNANDATNNVEVIWGEPAYFWFIPSLDSFATIKFAKSVADTTLLNHFFADFVKLQSTLRQRLVEERDRTDGSKYLSVSFPSEHENCNLWFRSHSRMFTKITEQADLAAMARDITHLVKREVIAARGAPEQTWERLFTNLPFISSTTTKETRNVEVIIEARPTASELREMFQTYNDHYAGGMDKWVNIGFKKEGAGRTIWLNEFVIKNFLPMGLANDSGHYSPHRLFQALHLVRTNLIAPLTHIAREQDQVA